MQAIPPNPTSHLTFLHLSLSSQDDFYYIQPPMYNIAYTKGGGELMSSWEEEINELTKAKGFV